MGEINFFPDDYDVQNQKVILRLDLNVPLKDKVIQDDTRIAVILPFLKKLLAIAPTITKLSTFFIKFVITLIFVEIFDPPIMHVTGSFLFLTTRLMASISFFNKGPAKDFLTNLVIL